MNKLRSLKLIVKRIDLKGIENFCRFRGAVEV